MTPAPPPISPRTPSARRRRPTARDEVVRLGVDALARLALMPSTTPPAADLADALGWTPATLAPVLAALERGGMVETWDDDGRRRVMLSMRSVVRLGLRLADDGKRWTALARWPDEPPTPPTAAAKPTPRRDDRRSRVYRRFSAKPPRATAARRKPVPATTSAA